jgi:hypothetical protein
VSQSLKKALWVQSPLPTRIVDLCLFRLERVEFRHYCDAFVLTRISRVGSYTLAHREERMTLITAVVYLALVTWAIIKSNRRWMTLLWTLVGLAATLGSFAGAALIWPDRTEMFGHMALIPSLLISALIGVNHMLSNPRPLGGRNAF